MKTPECSLLRRPAVLALILFTMMLTSLTPAFAQRPNLTGTVVRESGSPLDGGTVELLEPGGDQVKHRVYTDSRGAFAFRAPAGSYELRVKFGSRVLPQKMDDETRKRRPVTLTSDPQRLRIEVKTR